MVEKWVVEVVVLFGVGVHVGGVLSFVRILYV
jgi:hypothetical protein